VKLSNLPFFGCHYERDINFRKQSNAWGGNVLIRLIYIPFKITTSSQMCLIQPAVISCKITLAISFHYSKFIFNWSVYATEANYVNVTKIPRNLKSNLFFGCMKGVIIYSYPSGTETMQTRYLCHKN